MLLEVFRAGNAAASAEGITPADLADVASFDCSANPVPHVLGHPQTDTPALGPVRGFKADGNALLADLDETHPGFAKVVAGVKAGTILNRSMQFFGKFHRSNPTPGKLAPKHLGWLGGAAPGIPGMPALAKALAFGDGELIEAIGDAAPAVVLEPAATPVISFSEAPAPASKGSPTVATEAEIAERERLIAEREKAAEEREKTFAADRKTARETANTATVKGLVAAGKVLPAREAELIVAFNAVDGDDLVEFGADKAKASPVAKIAEIMAEGGKVTPPAGQHTPTGDAPAFSAEGGDKAKELADARAARLAKFNQ